MVSMGLQTMAVEYTSTALSLPSVTMRTAHGYHEIDFCWVELGPTYKNSEMYIQSAD